MNIQRRVMRTCLPYFFQNHTDFILKKSIIVSSAIHCMLMKDIHVLLQHITNIRGTCTCISVVLPNIQRVLKLISFPLAWPRGYTTFFVLNSTEHEISTALKNVNTDK